MYYRSLSGSPQLILFDEGPPGRGDAVILRGNLVPIHLWFNGRIFDWVKFDERGLLDLFLHAMHGVVLFGSSGIMYWGRRWFRLLLGDDALRLVFIYHDNM